MGDMLGALLASDDHFSDEVIVDFLVALLVAGYETTSTIMTLAVKFLTETPLALAQLKVHTLIKPPLATQSLSRYHNLWSIWLVPRFGTLFEGGPRE